MAQVRVNIDIPEGFFNIQAFQTELKAAMHKIAWEAQDYWNTLAGQRLKTSRAEYQAAIRVGGTSDNGMFLELDGGFLPYAVEVGVSSYQMIVSSSKIAPLNVNRDVPFTNPTLWRRGGGQERPWRHPGFTGMNMRDEVAEYVAEELVPKYLEEALEKL